MPPSFFRTINLILVMTVLIALTIVGIRAYKNEKNLSNTPGVSSKEISQEKNNKERKTYKDDQYGFSFEYPAIWLLNDELASTLAEGIVNLISPENKKSAEESLKKVSEGEYYYVDFVVDQCEAFDTNCLGVGNPGKSYKNIEEFLADVEGNSDYERINNMRTVNMGGLKGYGVLIGGLGIHFAVMVEHNNNVFTLHFPSTESSIDLDTRTVSLSPEQQHILSSFRFTR